VKAWPEGGKKKVNRSPYRKKRGGCHHGDTGVKNEKKKMQGKEKGIVIARRNFTEEEQQSGEQKGNPTRKPNTRWDGGLVEDVGDGKEKSKPQKTGGGGWGAENRTKSKREEGRTGEGVTKDSRGWERCKKTGLGEDGTRGTGGRMANKEKVEKEKKNKKKKKNPKRPLLKEPRNEGERAGGDSYPCWEGVLNIGGNFIN